MTFDELRAALLRAIEQGGALALINQDENAPFPDEDWPKGELLFVNEDGNSAWQYDAEALLRALESHKEELL